MDKKWGGRTPRPRFLIDENLSPRLAVIAREQGYEAAHLRDIGLLKAKDWDLLKVIIDGDWTLVTNNVEEFRQRYRRQAALHAGVVFLEGVDAGRNAQIKSFTAALDDIDASPEIVNVEILVQPENSGTYIVRRFDLP
jgi:predicted nuclease of predicted toxin-antitoxin system